jgi:hypothetical protein
MTRPGLLRLRSGDMRRQDVERQPHTTKEPDQLDVVIVRYAAAFCALRSAFTAPTTDTVRPGRLSPFPSFCFCPCRPVVRISPPSDFSFLLSQFLLSPKVPTKRTAPVPISGLTRFPGGVANFLSKQQKAWLNGKDRGNLRTGSKEADDLPHGSTLRRMVLLRGRGGTPPSPPSPHRGSSLDRLRTEARPNRVFNDLGTEPVYGIIPLNRKPQGPCNHLQRLSIRGSIL